MAEDREEVDQDEIVDAEIVDDVTPDAGVGDETISDSATGEAPAADTEPTPAGQKSVGSEPAAARPVVRRKVVSKRVTPKGGGPARSSGPATRASIAAAQERAKKKGLDPDEALIDEEPSFAQRHQASAQLPSPTWVPVLMFALLIVGAVVIILNYMGTFGDPSNVRLIIGLVFILGGIITATQYR